MPTLPLTARQDVDGVLTALHDAAALVPTPVPVTLTLGPKVFFDPSGLATLAAWGARHRGAGGTVTVEGDPQQIAYLSRMNVLDALGVPRAETGPRRASDGRLVEAMALHAPDGRFTDAVCDLVLHHFDDARAFLPALEWAVNEVSDNVHIHAQGATPAYACAQFYPRRHRLDVAVVDAGRGLRASLAESFEVPDDGTAIDLAMQRGVTRSLEVGQGNGLAGARQIAQVNRGGFSIWTGTHRHRENKDGAKPPRIIPTWAGTGVRLTLDTRRPVDLRQTFIEGTSLSFVDALAERLEDDGLDIAASCSHFGARPPATRLRRKVRTLLESMEEPLTLDFSGVPTASSSFLDELLGRLVDELGATAFHQRVRVAGANEAVARRANVVISQRMGGSQCYIRVRQLPTHARPMAHAHHTPPRRAGRRLHPEPGDAHPRQHRR